MVIRAIAIPLACYPYSSTSRIVHWLTRHHGKISTLLKGALRPKSPFLGEYGLFSTSELLYFEKRANTLHTGKECAMLQQRSSFRTNWRAMQTASYIAALVDRTTPDEAPQPGLFELFEELLDLTEEFGAERIFLPWAELRFAAFHGHAVHLADAGDATPRFSAEHGGVIAADYAKAHRITAMPFPRDVLQVLRNLQAADHPQAALDIKCTSQQMDKIDLLMEKFMSYQFELPTTPRHAVTKTLCANH